MFRVITANLNGIRSAAKKGFFDWFGEQDADVRTLRGWRRELVGEELLALLHGRRALSVLNRRLQVIAPADS